MLLWGKGKLSPLPLTMQQQPYGVYVVLNHLWRWWSAEQTQADKGSAMLPRDHPWDPAYLPVPSLVSHSPLAVQDALQPTLSLPKMPPHTLPSPDLGISQPPPMRRSYLTLLWRLNATFVWECSLLRRSANLLYSICVTFPSQYKGLAQTQDALRIAVLYLGTLHTSSFFFMHSMRIMKRCWAWVRV